jgi:hypothetical protein
VIPPEKRHFYEMLELIKRKNPDYHPRPDKYMDPSFKEEMRAIETMVELNMNTMLSPVALESTQIEQFAMNQSHFE